jgi:hypothetical protein
MPVSVQEQGDYELFETNHQHRILVLNNRQWFAWIEGQQGEILVRSDPDHVRDHTIQQGKFFLVDFEEDPNYKDMPHLFLQKGDHYQEAMLPNGLPTERDPQKKIVMTDKTLPREKVENDLMHPAPAGPGEERTVGPGGGSMADVAQYLQGIYFPAVRTQVLAYAHDQAAPSEVMAPLMRLPNREFGSMADLMQGLNEGADGVTGSTAPAFGSRRAPGPPTAS